MTDRTIDLLRKARDEIQWWADEHGCCAGHATDLLAELDAHLQRPEAPEGAQPVAWQWSVGGTPPWNHCDEKTAERQRKWPGVVVRELVVASPAPAGQSEEARDAARYRWLRDEGNAKHPAWIRITEIDCAAGEMDTLVDAAMRKETP